MIARSEKVNRHLHLYVPDARITASFPFPDAEAYSAFHKSFPVFGKVIGATWYASAGGAATEDDQLFSYELSAWLNENEVIAEALAASELRELVVFTEDCAHGVWTICHSGSYRRPEHRAAYEALARSLVQFPIPTPDELLAAD